MKKSVLLAFLFNVLLVTVVMAVVNAAEGQAPQRPVSAFRLPEQAKALDDEWHEVKAAYRDRFKTTLDDIDRRLEQLLAARDFGDEKRRRKISEGIRDLQRARERIERRHAELKAATAVSFANIKNRINDALNDLKD
jgi:hypothetical protein